MTARTHDLFAATLGVLAIAYFPIPAMSIATAIAGVIALFLGGLAPDLDEPSSELWQRMPAGSGSILGRVVHPTFGSHRFITHSLLGMWLVGKALWWLLIKVQGVILVDMNIVWWAFMIGFLSHLVADSLTKEGVPWVFPIQWKLGFPPIRSLRVTTGALAEKAFIFPGLLFLNGYVFYHHKQTFLAFIKTLF